MIPEQIGWGVDTRGGTVYGAFPSFEVAVLWMNVVNTLRPGTLLGVVKIMYPNAQLLK